MLAMGVLFMTSPGLKARGFIMVTNETDQPHPAVWISPTTLCHCAFTVAHCSLACVSLSDEWVTNLPGRCKHTQ
jgi:predicted double-glycine peptidase